MITATNATMADKSPTTATNPLASEVLYEMAAVAWTAAEKPAASGGLAQTYTAADAQT